MVNTILFFGLILLALVIGTRWKVNIGLVAAAFAFPLGTLAGGLSASEVVALFPMPLFFNFMIANFLFGFAGSNGTLKKLAGHLLYACRHAGWMLGLLFFLVTALISAMGAGGSAPFFMSAVCFSLAAQSGINPLLVVLSVWMGAMVGGGMPWTFGYATNIGQLVIYFNETEAVRYVNGFYVWRAVFYTLLYLVMFFALKGYRVGGEEQISLEKPEPFEKKQKVTLAVICGIIILIVIPALIRTVCPGPLTERLGDIFTFQFLAIVGVIINVLCKTAPYQAVLKEKIPWDTLLMLSLTGMYMALANSLGIVEVMAEVLQNRIPADWIIPGVVLLMCILSFFVSGRVVIPMMLPLIPVFAEASAVSAAAVYCAMQVGLTASSISPFSQGGAAALSGCGDEALRKKLIGQQVVLSGVFSAVMFVIAMAGGFSML